METEFLIMDDRDETPENLSALVFGQLVKRAQNVMEAYQSDLYHDATWLRMYLEPDTPFFWGVGDFGTYIGSELYSSQRETMYQVTVWKDKKYYWYATFRGV